MVRAFFLLLIFPLFVFANTNLPRGLKGCLAKLSSAEEKEISVHFDQALLVKGLKDSEEARLLLLETLLKNTSFLKSISDAKGSVASKFKNFINQGASQNFYKRVIELVEQYSPPHALSYIILAKQSLLPAFMPAPTHMPPAALQANPKRTRILISGLEIIFESNLYIKPVHFTRRLFAYVSRYPELTQYEKFNLVSNLISEFRTQVEDYNLLLAKKNVSDKSSERIPLYSFYPSPEVAADGTRFICGTIKCGYYFAFMEDGRFFIVHRDHSSSKFDPDTWNQHQRVREGRPNADVALE